jgi:hypothetical protein
MHEKLLGEIKMAQMSLEEFFARREAIDEEFNNNDDDPEYMQALLRLYEEYGRTGEESDSPTT